MRILLVNWARVWEGATHGGGANGYTQGLALALTALGHTVATVASGNLHVSDPADRRRRGPLRLWRYKPWRGIASYEIVNSPVLSPSLHQFREPLGEIANPALETAFTGVLDKVDPEVVHFQNVEGFTIGCVDAARRRGSVVVSLHNYHTICPQVYLMQGHRRPCQTIDNGHACAACISTPKPQAWIGRTLRPDPFAGSDGPHEPGSLPGPPLVDRLRRGSARLGRAWRLLRSGMGDSLASPLTPLTNSIVPEPVSARPPNDYARRRAAMIAMLNRCDAVLAVSEFVRDKFVSRGVDEPVVRTMHIGSRITSLSPPPLAPREEGGPVRLLFLGYNNYYKGLPMLADSLESLPPRVLGRLDLSLHVMGARSARLRFRALRGGLAGLTIREGYRFEDIPRLCAGHDAGLVTSVWWDNGPQTVFEFQGCGLPVIGAAVGGVPDFVRDGHNGLLFRANDREDLARVLGRVAEDPTLLTRLKANVRPPKSMEFHAEEIVRLYGSVRATRSQPAPSVEAVSPRAGVRGVA